MNTLKSLITTVLMFCAGQLLYGAAPSAAEIVRQASARLRSMPALEAKFSVKYNSEVTDGSILLSGDKFAITTPEVSTWFDGKTQWAYSAAIDEVNVSEPTAGELAQINPMAILGSVQAGYTARRLSAPQGTDKIELTPVKGNSDYRKIVITFNSATLLPEEFDITTSDRNVMQVRISSAKECARPADSRFRFSPEQYPGVEVVDLR